MAGRIDDPERHARRRTELHEQPKDELRRQGRRELCAVGARHGAGEDRERGGIVAHTERLGGARDDEAGRSRSARPSTAAAAIDLAKKVERCCAGQPRVSPVRCRARFSHRSMRRTRVRDSCDARRVGWRPSASARARTEASSASTNSMSPPQFLPAGSSCTNCTWRIVWPQTVTNNGPHLPKVDHINERTLPRVFGTEVANAVFKDDDVIALFLAVESETHERHLGINAYLAFITLNAARCPTQAVRPSNLRRDRTHRTRSWPERRLGAEPEEYAELDLPEQPLGRAPLVDEADSRHTRGRRILGDDDDGGLRMESSDSSRRAPLARACHRRRGRSRSARNGPSRHPGCPPSTPARSPVPAGLRRQSHVLRIVHRRWIMPHRTQRPHVACVDTHG